MENSEKESKKNRLFLSGEEGKSPLPLLLQQGKEGDEWALTQLLQAFEPLIRSSYRRYAKNKGEKEDLLQEGRIAFLQGVEDFDLKRKIPFPGYAKTRLKYFYLNRKEETRLLSLDAPTEEGYSLGDLIGDEDTVEKILLDLERKNLLYESLGEIGKRQEAVIRLSYLEEYDLHTIAGYLGMTYKTAVNTRLQGLKALEKVLRRNGVFRDKEEHRKEKSLKKGRTGKKRGVEKNDDHR